PQKDIIYSDLKTLAEAGIITSTSKEYFENNAITRLEAAGYIIEAKNNNSNAEYNNIIVKYEKLFSNEISKIKNNEINNEEWKTELEIDDIRAELDKIEEEYKKTTFNDSSAFKVTGYISGRWQDLITSGIAKKHLSAMSGTNLSLYTETNINNKARFAANFYFEMPQFDPAYGTSLQMFYGTTKPIALDIYTLNFYIDNWQITTGFFWEDITSFIASQSVSERIGIFDRDIYAGEEATLSYFERIFRNYFTQRDQRWSKHQFNGIDIIKNNTIGRDRLKIMGGKATFENDFQYEIAGRYTQYKSFAFLKNAEWSLNFYNNSNQREELLAFTNSQSNPESLLRNITIFGGDVKTTIEKLFKFSMEYERSYYGGRIDVQPSVTLLPNFHQNGNAFYFEISPLFLRKGINFVFKYIMIDDNYVAPASAVIDTNYRTIKIGDPTKVEIKPLTYVGDPTSYHNNMNKVELNGFFNIPNGLLLLNYGISTQIKKTGNTFYSTHWLNNNEWWKIFYSNYGWVDAGLHTPFVNYNKNRYGIDTSSGSGAGRTINIIAGGKGGMTTDIWSSNREYMVSSAVTEDTNKYLNNILVLLRYELNKLLRLKQSLFFEFYGELITLSNAADILVTYDPSKLLSQNLMSFCLIYNILKKINLIGYIGIERWASESVIPKPIDYLDNAYGIGIDYDLSARAFLYLRLKNFYHNDAYVPANNFSGWRVWLELKSFF
ncbi:MAG: hypothetical protein N3E50_08680, partial [Candidatus Goldbacteria bacterium]|nr:hypothetical protein [Candidatus Goldiibacteriota bacterium]